MEIASKLIVVVFEVVVVYYIVSKGREYAGQQTTRDARREKILSVCEDLQTLVGERLAKMEADAVELKKTVKELSRKVKIGSISVQRDANNSSDKLLQGALLLGEEVAPAVTEDDCGSSLRFVHQFSQPNQCHARLCGTGQKTGKRSVWLQI